MAQIRRTFPSFVGGEEKVYQITHTERGEASEPQTALDLTGYGIAAEVWWEGCRKLSPAVTIVNLAPPDPVAGEDPSPHYTVTLSEGQTACVPIGKIAFVRLIRVSPSGETTIRAPIYLNRTA